MITADIAYRLRFERGLALLISKEYSHPRLLAIAEEEKELFARLEALDNEIAEIKDNEEKAKKV